MHTSRRDQSCLFGLRHFHLSSDSEDEGGVDTASSRLLLDRGTVNYGGEKARRNAANFRVDGGRIWTTEMAE